MRLLYALAFLCALTGCNTISNLEAAPVEARSRVIAAPQSRVFDAALSRFVAGGFTVTTSDRAAGVLATDYRENNGTLGDQITREIVGRQRLRVAAVAQALTDSTTRLTLTFSSSGAAFSPEQASALYAVVLDGIEAEATGQPVAERPPPPPAEPRRSSRAFTIAMSALAIGGFIAFVVLEAGNQ